MGRKPKQNIKMEINENDELIGCGAIPTQVLVEGRSKFGGSVCCICRKHIDLIDDNDEIEIEGAGYLSKFAEKVETTARKGASKVKKAGKKTGKYVTDTKGLASDVINYGIPAASAATLSALASPLGPAGQIGASAIGSKLGTMAADKIAKESSAIESRTGEGLKPKRKPRFEKGSQEAKDYMRSLREKRQKK